MNRITRRILKLLGWTALVFIPSILFSTYVWDCTVYMSITVVSVVELLVFWIGYFKFFWEK